MRTADYRCGECGFVAERVFDGSTIPPTVDEAHLGGPEYRSAKGCYNAVLTRVWGPVAIGAVPGAGGSPSRS